MFKHDREELSPYTKEWLCVYPAVPAPGKKRNLTLLLVEAGMGQRLKAWQNQWMETDREMEKETP